MNAAFINLVFLLVGVAVGSAPMLIWLLLTQQFFTWVKKFLESIKPINEEEEKNSARERFRRHVLEG